MTDEPKNLGGRPPHVPTAATRKQVLTLSGYGVPQVEIAQTIGISKPTLQAHYRAELDAGITQANAKVAESLFKKAIGDGPSSVTAAIFWAKTRMGWKEPPQALEHSGPGGAPIATLDVSTLTHDQLTALEPVLAALAGSSGNAGEGEGGDPQARG